MFDTVTQRLREQIQAWRFWGHWHTHECRCGERWMHSDPHCGSNADHPCELCLDAYEWHDRLVAHQRQLVRAAPFVAAMERRIRTRPVISRCQH
jgi:hypothetical protein